MLKKLISKVLYVVLALVLGICAFIVACSFNPDLAKETAGITGKFGDEIRAKIVEKKAQELAEQEGKPAASSAEISASEIENSNLLADASAAVSSYTTTVPSERKFSDYANSWNAAGIDEGYLEKYDSTPVEIAVEETPMVNEDLESDLAQGLDINYYNTTDNKSDFILIEPVTVEISDSSALVDLLQESGYGGMGTDYSFDKEMYPYYHMLNSKCKALYNQIYENISKQRKVFIPSKRVKSAEFQNALMSVIYDHPELFWLDTSYYTEYICKGEVVKVELSFYDDEFPDIDAAKQTFENSVLWIIAGAQEEKDDFAKEVYVHDLLADSLSYSTGGLGQSAYSAIVGNESADAGYAKAFQYLMQRMNIPTYLCVGWAGGLVSGDMHAWNIVKLGNDYYNVDCSWDDQEIRTYKYFNKTDEDNHRHTRMNNSRYLPECNGKKYVISEKNS